MSPYYDEIRDELAGVRLDAAAQRWIPARRPGPHPAALAAAALMLAALAALALFLL